MPRSLLLSDAATVFVIDPDPSTSEVARGILDGSEIACVAYPTGREFLSADGKNQPGCVVLEQRIPDMSGLQLQHRLAASDCLLPLVFVTARIDVSTAVELMRGGAVHVLEKPVRAAELTEAIHEAIALSRKRRSAKQATTRLKRRTAALSRKELQVLELIAAGNSPKSIAAELELSVRAVELRRHSLMTKLELSSSAELMRFAVLAEKGLQPAADHSLSRGERGLVRAR